MTSDKYLLLSDGEKQKIESILSTDLPPGYKDLSSYDVYSREFSFYPDWSYLEISSSESVSAKPVCALVRGSEGFVMDWTIDQLYKFNETVPLKLSIGNVCEYLEFFLAHTRGSEGPMVLVNSSESFKWREEPPLAVRKALSSLIQPATLASWNEQTGDFEVNAHTAFRNHLFSVLFHVNRSGQIDAKERQILVEDMPLFDEVIGQ